MRGRRPAPHHGTWNANLLAAGAGLATLRLVATGEPAEIATARADALRTGLNELSQLESSCSRVRESIDLEDDARRASAHVGR